MYSIYTTSDFVKQFKKLDKSVQIMVSKWIKKHLKNTDNPRAQGKPLTANLKGYWRYRIGNYRLLAEINDSELTIVAIEIAHRSTVYDNK